MTSNKILFTLLITLSFSLTSFAQTFEVMNIDCFDKNGNQYLNPFAGGMNAPQFNEIDLDLDGIMDLIVMDREGSALIPYIYKNDRYEYAPEYKEFFPPLKKWVRVRDYNAD